MAANTAPIYTRVAQDSWGTVVTANTALDGTGTVVTVFTADATNGGRVENIRVMHLGSNSVATVLRVFENNGSTNATAANNILRYEATISANTLNQAAASVPVDISVGRALPPGYKFNITIGTTLTAGLAVSAQGGAY